MQLGRCVLGGAAALLLAGTASAAMPNRSYTSDQLYQRISPELSATHHNQPMVINGHLLLAGNAEHELWDISDPFKPAQLSTFASPHHDGEAESHQVSFRKTKDDRYLAVLISGKGVDLWDLTDVENPALLSHMDLEGIDYGDNTNAVWGVFWQGDYIFVGGTNTGLHIVDASDPTQPALVKNMPTTELGGVSAGPLFAVGNLLVVTTPKEHAGIATLDIGDPANPALLDFELPETKSYIGWMFKGNLHLLTPFRTYDVTTDPSDIQLIGSDETAASEYMSFADDTLFLGALRPEGGNYKIDISDPNDLEELAFIEGRRDQEIFGGTFIGRSVLDSHREPARDERRRAEYRFGARGACARAGYAAARGGLHQPTERLDDAAADDARGHLLRRPDRSEQCGCQLPHRAPRGRGASCRQLGATCRPSSRSGPMRR